MPGHTIAGGQQHPCAPAAMQCPRPAPPRAAHLSASAMQWSASLSSSSAMRFTQDSTVSSCRGARRSAAVVQRAQLFPSHLLRASLAAAPRRQARPGTQRRSVCMHPSPPQPRQLPTSSSSCGLRATCSTNSSRAGGRLVPAGGALGAPTLLGRRPRGAGAGRGRGDAGRSCGRQQRRGRVPQALPDHGSRPSARAPRAARMPHGARAATRPPGPGRGYARRSTAKDGRREPRGLPLGPPGPGNAGRAEPGGEGLEGLSVISGLSEPVWPPAPAPRLPPGPRDLAAGPTARPRPGDRGSCLRAGCPHTPGPSSRAPPTHL